MSDKGTAGLAPGAGWDGPLAFGEANLGLAMCSPAPRACWKLDQTPGWVIQEENGQAGKSPNTASKCSLS